MAILIESYMAAAIKELAVSHFRESESQFVRTALVNYLGRPIDMQYVKTRRAIAPPPVTGGAGIVSMQELKRTGTRGPSPRFAHRISFLLTDSLRSQLDLRAEQEQVGKATLVRRAIDYQLSALMLGEDVDGPAVHETIAVEVPE
jgi:hypothetical protein